MVNHSGRIVQPRHFFLIYKVEAVWMICVIIPIMRTIPLLKGYYFL